MTKSTKPLGGPTYGSIPHLPGSRLGLGDHCITTGQARICTEKVRDYNDLVIVQEKVDGSCCAAARIGNEIVPLTRAGYVATSSKYKQHHLFHDWCLCNKKRIMSILEDGERLCGEWIAQAHGTRYDMSRLEPFIAFDIMKGSERLLFYNFCERVFKNEDSLFQVPYFVNYGPISIEDAMDDVNINCTWCLDKPEGIVYRVERNGTVDFLAKYVRPDKQDGCYLPEVSKKEIVWNWLP